MDEHLQDEREAEAQRAAGIPQRYPAARAEKEEEERRGERLNPPALSFSISRQTESFTRGSSPARFAFIARRNIP